VVHWVLLRPPWWVAHWLPVVANSAFDWLKVLDWS